MAESRGSNMHQYEVVGRHKPTERKPDPEVLQTQALTVLGIFVFCYVRSSA